MEQLTSTTPRWNVSARSDGEVLAVRVGGLGLDLGFLGSPSGFTPAEVETWLTELIGVAGMTGGESPAVRDPGSSIAIPRVLHQALTGLLFYEAELWGGAGDRPPCTLACVAGAGAVAFGCTGPGRVEITKDGWPFEPVWLLVRDQDGRDARAFVVEARCPLEVRVSWPAAGSGQAAAGEISALWPGRAGEEPEACVGLPSAEVSAREELPGAPVADGSASTADGERTPASGRPRGFWQFRGWMDRLAGPRARQEDQPDGSQEPEPIAHDVPGVPDLLPEPEPVVAEAPAVFVERPPGPEVAEAPAVAVERSPGPEVADARAVVVERSPEPEVAEAPADVVERSPGPEVAEAPVVVVERSPEPVVAEAPAVVVERSPEPEVAEAPAVFVERLPRAVIVEAPVVVAPSPRPVIAEAPPIEEPLGAESELAVDPFDLGPLPEPEPVPRPAVVAPEAVPAAAQEPAPAVAAAAPASEPQLDVALARALELVAESEPVSGASPRARQAGVVGEVAKAATPRPRPRTVVRRPAWPAPEELAKADERPFWRRPWFAAVVVVALFAGGWLLGRVDFSHGSKSVGAALQAIGLGPARYEVAATSRPSGAWITVDGVDQAVRTPATLKLKPGRHEVVFSFSGVGGSSHPVEGKRGQRVPLDVELWGALKVTVPPGSGPVSVVVDGMPRGYAPLDVDRLQPGIHRLQFSGPGVAPWEQTVEVHVNRTAELVAQPMVSPATGVLEVRATLADEAGSEPLSGAQVWIDGQPRGATPLKLELPRGPHSIRVRYRNEDAPVQVIELPGGNVRYATIQLGLDADAPRLAASLPAYLPIGRSTVMSASLDQAREGDVREMWLHVRTPEGAWRRYPMTVMKAPAGLVGVCVFPTVLFDARGRTSWYVSALTPMGDEYFTEMQPAQAGRN